MSFNGINKIFVTFLQNSRDLDAHRYLNIIYSDILPHPERSFVDEDSCKTLKDGTALTTEIHRQIIDMTCAQAIQTEDMTVIPPVGKDCYSESGSW